MAPIVTDPTSLAFSVAGVASVGVDATLELSSTTPNFVKGTGTFYTTTLDNYMTGAFKVVASGLTSMTLYYWRLTLTNGTDSIDYPSTTTTNSQTTCIIGGVLPANGNTVSRIYCWGNTTVNGNFLCTFQAETAGVQSYPMSAISGAGTGLASFVTNNVRKTSDTDYMQFNPATIVRYGAYGNRWGSYWYNNTIPGGEPTSSVAPAGPGQYQGTTAPPALYDVRLNQVWYPPEITGLSPASPSSDNTPIIYYTYPGGLTSLNLWYATVATGPYTLIGNDQTIDGTYTVPSPIPDGTYYFAAVSDLELSPPTASEFGPYIINTRPYIVSTAPASGATGVPVTANIVITFSEAINTATFMYTCAPNPGGLTVMWSGGNTMATLTHNSFQDSTLYTFQITAAQDFSGLTLTSGPVPNPWSFTASGHYKAKATGPVGNSANAALTITYTPDCGCFGWIHIYYSSDKNMTWNYLGVEEVSWFEDGVRSWTAPGSGDYWWYAGNGATDTSCDDPPGPGTPAEAGPYTITLPLPPHYDIPVIAGWNLISFPVIASGSPETVLSDLGGNTVWSVLKWYNPETPQDPWKTYRAGGMNDLTAIDNTKGLWVYITNPGSDNLLRVAGTNPGTTQIPLYTGWNMVGYPTNSSETVGIALWGTGADKVYVFDAAEPGFIKEVGPTYAMTPGKGYWIHVNSDAIWTINW